MTDCQALRLMSEEDLCARSFHELPVARLCSLSNPLGCWAELSRPITRKEVRKCIADGRQALLETPLWTSALTQGETSSPEIVRDNHVRKIAYFVVNGVRDPIDVDVGIPSMGCFVQYLVEDGNHRLAGAWIRGDRVIKASVAGSIEYAKSLALWHPNEFEEELQRRYDTEKSSFDPVPRKKSPADPSCFLAMGLFMRSVFAPDVNILTRLGSLSPKWAQMSMILI